MYNAKIEREWDHTATICSLHANLNSNKGRKYTLYDFHPYRKKPVTDIATFVSQIKPLFKKD